jgi:hypothetical protein
MEQLEQDIEKEHTADWTERPRVESLGTKTAAGNTEVYDNKSSEQKTSHSWPSRSPQIQVRKENKHNANSPLLPLPVGDPIRDSMFCFVF